MFLHEQSRYAVLGIRRSAMDFVMLASFTNANLEAFFLTKHFLYVYKYSVHL